MMTRIDLPATSEVFTFRVDLGRWALAGGPLHMSPVFRFVAGPDRVQPGRGQGRAEGPHPALAHLSIDAASLPAAITAAVRQIERLGIAVTSVQSTDLVSLKDIAARTGRSYESVRKLAHGQRGPGGFPAPLSTGQCGPYPLRWTPGLAARFVGRARNGFDTPLIYA